MIVCSFFYTYVKSQTISITEINQNNNNINIEYELHKKRSDNEVYDVGLYYTKNKGKKWNLIPNLNANGDVGKNISVKYPNKSISWRPTLKDEKKIKDEDINFGLKIEKTQGKLTIKGKPKYASVYLDNEYIGLTPLKSYPLKSKIIYELKISKKNYINEVKENLHYNFNKNEYTIDNYNLQKDPYIKIKRNKLFKNLSLTTSLAFLTYGSLKFIEANQTYRQYQNSTNNSNALKSEHERLSNIFPISLSIGGSMLLTSIVLNKKLKKKLSHINEK